MALCAYVSPDHRSVTPVALIPFLQLRFSLFFTDFFVTTAHVGTDHPCSSGRTDRPTVEKGEQEALNWLAS